MHIAKLPSLPGVASCSLAISLTASLFCAFSPAHAEEDPPAIELPTSSVSLTHRGATITAQAFSPNGRILAVGMTDGTVALYDLQAKRWTVQTGRLQSSGIQAAALSPDGALLAACGEDDSVTVADARSGAILRKLPVGRATVSLAFAPDGKSLAAGTTDGREDDPGLVLLWSVPGFHLQKTLKAVGPVWAVGFSQSSGRLLAASNESIVFALPSGKKIWGRDNLGARSGAISPDGSIVGGGIGIWNIDTGKQISDQTNQDSYSGFSRTGGLLVCGGSEDSALALDGRTGKVLTGLKIYDDFCAVSPTGSLLASGFGGRDITFYQLDEQALRKVAYAREHPTQKQIIQKKLADAVGKGDLTRVKSALAQGADPNGAYSEYETLLSEAAGIGSLPIVQALIDAGARFTPTDPQFARRMLGQAVSSGNIALAQWMLAHEMTLEPNTGSSPLMIAAEKGDTVMIAFLLDHGVAIDERYMIHGETPLMAAAENKKTDAVKLLLQRGANPKIMTSADSTDSTYVPVNALTKAVEGGDAATVAALADATPNLNDPAAFHLPLAVHAVGPKSEDVLRVLLEKGVDPNVRDAEGETALIVAASLGFTPCVAALLAHHADINAKDKDGKTALDLSTDAEATKLLTDAGAKSQQQ